MKRLGSWWRIASKIPLVAIPYMFLSISPYVSLYFTQFLWSFPMFRLVFLPVFYLRSSDTSTASADFKWSGNVDSKMLLSYFNGIHLKNINFLCNHRSWEINLKLMQNQTNWFLVFMIHFKMLGWFLSFLLLLE